MCTGARECKAEVQSSICDAEMHDTTQNKGAPTTTTLMGGEKHIVKSIEVEDEVSKDDAHDFEVCCLQAGNPNNHQVTAVSTNEVEPVQSVITSKATVSVVRSSYTVSANDQYGTVEHEEFETLPEETRKVRALYRRLTNPAD